MCLYYAYESPELSVPVVDRCVHTVSQLENQALLCLHVFVLLKCTVFNPNERSWETI